MIVAKVPRDPLAGRRRVLHFDRARDALQAYLEYAVPSPNPVVLLPAYVGWSPREGSGLIDPIRAARGKPVFYRLDACLDIDVEDFECALVRSPIDVAVVVHYFGRPDPRLQDLARICRAHSVQLLEDEAHAMLTDLVGGICGREGDATIYSLHKLLPFESGGALVLNTEPAETELQALVLAQEQSRFSEDWTDYDLLRISERRRENRDVLVEQMAALSGMARPLWPEIDARVVPQTFPLVLETGDRDQVHEKLNARGFGVVSLYHTLVRELPDGVFAECRGLSRRILNLPVHQDVSPSQLAPLIRALRCTLEGS